MKLFSIAFMTLFSLTVLAQDPEDLVAEGVALHDQGNYNGAIAKYDEALALDDEFVLAIGEKAMTLNVIGRYREAIKLCLQAIDLEGKITELGASLSGMPVLEARKKAIEKGVKLLKTKKGLLIIAGKGHENIQIYKDKNFTFNDRLVAKSYAKYL